MLDNAFHLSLEQTTRRLSRRRRPLPGGDFPPRPSPAAADATELTERERTVSS